jgi:hypothetical protein
MNIKTILDFIVISAILTPSGCSTEDDGAASADGGTNNGMDGAPRDAYTFDGTSLKEDGSVNIPNDGCSELPGLNEYTDSGVNVSVYNSYEYGSLGEKLPISQMYIYCFTKGSNCNKYTIDLMLYVDADRLPDYSLGGRSIDLLACEKRGFPYSIFVKFIFNEEERIDDHVSPGTQVEIKGATIKADEPPFKCPSPPRIDVYASLKKANFFNISYPYKNGEDSGVTTADSGMQRMYITLKDTAGKVIAHFQ